MSCWKQSLSNQFLFMKTWQSKVCISRIGSRENDSIFDAQARLLLLDYDYNVMVITWCHHSWFPASSIFDLANKLSHFLSPWNKLGLMFRLIFKFQFGFEFQISNVVRQEDCWYVFVFCLHRKYVDPLDDRAFTHCWTKGYYGGGGNAIRNVLYTWMGSWPIITSFPRINYS